MTDAPVQPGPPGQVTGLRVFIHAPHGGNPVPLVADASCMDDAQMQAVARHHGHESAFVLPATDPRANWRLRFFVPQHEMEMCGHATVGTLWALRKWHAWTTPSATVQTLSGLVDAQWDGDGDCVWVSQPRARWCALDAAARGLVHAALRLTAGDAADDVVNATTSRAKTLVPLPTPGHVHALTPTLNAVRPVCEAIDSTGLYPYALAGTPGAPVLHARQFPRASGYAEDAATGIAAAALWGYLVHRGQIEVGTPAAPVTCIVRQGDAMGKPSAIQVRPRFDADGLLQGCWLSGRVDWMTL